MLFLHAPHPRSAAMLEASVIVPTKDRPRYLRVALESLAAQDIGRERYEVLVVDDGPSAATREVDGAGGAAHRQRGSATSSARACPG